MDLMKDAMLDPYSAHEVLNEDDAYEAVPTVTAVT